MGFLQQLLLMLLGVGMQMLHRLPGMRTGLYFASAIVMTALPGCSSVPIEMAHEIAAPRAFEPNRFIATKQGTQMRLASHEGRLADEVLSQVALSSGQIVLTANFAPISLFEALGIERYLPYSHIGILVIEDGLPFVYEMQSDEPDLSKIGTLDGFKGGMVRTALKEEIASRDFVSIFDLPPEADPAKLVAYIKKSYEQRVPFDPFFDSEDHSRLYCPELVAVALEQAGARAPRPVPFRNNPSLAVGYKWMNFHDTSILAPGLFADPARHVATLSPELSPMQVAAFFAVGRELHQRLTSDQRIAVLIEIKKSGQVEIQPSIRQFMSQVMLMARFAKTSDPEEIGEMVRRFAKTYFEDD